MRTRSCPAATTLGLCLVGAMALYAPPACAPQKVGASGLVMVGSAEADRIVHEKRGLLGLGEPVGAWVDPRSAQEYARGHIAQAIHLPPEKISGRMRELEGLSTMVVYGSDADDPRATAAARRLIDVGIIRVRVLQGGLRDWIDAGHEVETGGP